MMNREVIILYQDFSIFNINIFNSMPSLHLEQLVVNWNIFAFHALGVFYWYTECINKEML